MGTEQATKSATLAPAPSNVIHVAFGNNRRRAYDAYVKGSALDENPATALEAEAAYKEALRLNPRLDLAYTNLGNLRYRAGDERGAEALWHAALTVRQAQPEALYNLGHLLLERGESRQSIAWFEKAIEADPRFADAHFNLAMAWEQSGERGKADPHWRRYLELDPAGTGAEIAREHLGAGAAGKSGGRQRRS